MISLLFEKVKGTGLHLLKSQLLTAMMMLFLAGKRSQIWYFLLNVNINFQIQHNFTTLTFISKGVKTAISTSCSCSRFVSTIP